MISPKTVGEQSPHQGEEKMRVLKIEPRKEPEIIDIPDTLEAMQEAVGGYIEAIYPFAEEVAIVCNA